MAALGPHCCRWAFSSCGEQGLLFVAGRGLLIAVASLVAEHGLQVRGLQQLQHVGSVVVARGLQTQTQQLWRTDLVALRHVRSSPTRASTRVPCIGRRILTHCATREVPDDSLICPEYDHISPSLPLHPGLSYRISGTSFHLDYCNGIITSFPAPALVALQSVLNIAARVILLKPKLNPISCSQETLQRFPISLRIKTRFFTNGLYSHR